MSITDCRNGDFFTVQCVTLPREIGKRLADMGFTRGVRGMVVRCALFGDPIQVKILGYDVAIRRAEARGITVEQIKTEG